MFGLFEKPPGKKPQKAVSPENEAPEMEQPGLGERTPDTEEDGHRGEMPPPGPNDFDELKEKPEGDEGSLTREEMEKIRREYPDDDVHRTPGHA